MPNQYSTGSYIPDMSPTINSFVDNLVKLKMHQDDVDMQGRQLQQKQELIDIQKAESNLALGNAQKEKANREKPLDMTVHPLFLSLPDESKEQALNFMVTNGFTDERGIGTTENIMRGLDIVEKTKPVFQTIMGPVIKAKQANVTTAWGELQSAQEKGDPKKMQEAKAKFDQAFLTYGDALGKYDTHLKVLTDREAAEQWGEPIEPKDELNRQLERWNALKSQGKGDSFEAKAIEARIGKLTESGGMSFEVSPDGTVRMVQGGLGKALPATQKFTQQSQLDRYNTVIDVIDNTISNIQESPSRAGVIGSIRSLAQKAVGVAGDVSPDILADMMHKSVNAIPGLSEKQKGELSGYFDPAIPENEIYENTIALELAKLRVTAGGGGIRAIDRAFRDAKNDVAVTGMFSSNEVVARLKKVREEFMTEKVKQENRLNGGGEKTVVRTGTLNGRRVQMYSDGAVEYAD